MGKTALVLAVDAHSAIPVQTKFRANPPSLSIEFPGQSVVSALPERSVINRGVIQSVEARYRRSGSSRRTLQSLVLSLSGPYPSHRVRSEPGRILIEIDHPASVRSASIEVGLLGGTVIGGRQITVVSERFRAMQQAMSQATPTPWKIEFSGAASWEPAASQPASVSQAPAASATSPPAARTERRPAGRPIASLPPSWPLIGIGLAIAGGLWLLSTGRIRPWGARVDASSTTKLPSGVVFIDQLIWRAFERQGYQLIALTEPFQPTGSTFRIMTKDGAKAALGFAGNGPFFEKQTVGRFLAAMQEVRVTQGFLVASGAFTVPAQRLAKEHHIALIGREQLVELLSSGASSEFFSKQLEQRQAEVQEAKDTLRQYASELDMLRRQRNEASWFLGEERAKAGKLEAHLENVTQELHRHDGELKRWEYEVTALRKQWEESQWYLGESRERLQFLDGQLVRALDESSQQLRASSIREAILRSQLDQLTLEVEALRRHGERRVGTRVQVPATAIELWDPEGQLLVSGPSRDLSAGGFGCDTPGSVPELTPLRLRLRLPGSEPVEAGAELVWQRGSGVEGDRFRSGFRFVEPSEAVRHVIGQMIASSGLSDSG